MHLKISSKKKNKTKTYFGYLIGMTTASLSNRFAVSKPLIVSHLTSGLPRIISLHSDNIFSYNKYVNENTKFFRLSSNMNATNDPTCIDFLLNSENQQNQEEESEAFAWKRKGENKQILKGTLF